MGEPVRLNLGSGHKPLEGFINIDGFANERSKPDLLHDLTQPLPFKDGSVDEVHAYHLIEHLDRWTVPDVLKDWARVLKPGGMLVVECPCMDSVVELMWNCIQQEKPIPAALHFGLYGDPRHKEPAMMHRWGYWLTELEGLMQDAGLTVREAIPQTHLPIRDMRLEGIK